MLEELWDGIIGLSEQYVVPDWGALVLLIPIGLAALVGLYLSWTVYRFASAAPTRRGVQRLEPVAPPGVHMPGPSFAPILGAFGLFMLVFGLIAGGIWTFVGAAVLVITLLYWGREALRDYDHLPGVAETALVATGALPTAEPAPPPGVHLPPPSFRPLLVAVAMTILVAGLVVGGWAVIAGFAAVVFAGLGWLRDARREYVAVEVADRTGHLDLGGAPAWPKATFAVLAALIAGALLLTSGVLPNSGGALPAATGSAGGAAGGGGPATPSSPVPQADVSITAEGIAFLETAVTVPAGREFTLALDNRDQVPHNVEIKDGGGAVLFNGDIFSGPKVVVYTVPALPAGQYPFICSVHPNMTGTITAE